MKNKHLWLALGEGLLFMILFLHRYELEWMGWVQMLIYNIIGIKILDDFRIEEWLGTNKKALLLPKRYFCGKRVFCMINLCDILFQFAQHAAKRIFRACFLLFAWHPDPAATAYTLAVRHGYFYSTAHNMFGNG